MSITKLPFFISNVKWNKTPLHRKILWNKPIRYFLYLDTSKFLFTLVLMYLYFDSIVEKHQLWIKEIDERTANCLICQQIVWLVQIWITRQLGSYTINLIKKNVTRLFFSINLHPEMTMVCIFKFFQYNQHIVYEIFLSILQMIMNVFDIDNFRLCLHWVHLRKLGRGKGNKFWEQGRMFSSVQANGIVSNICLFSVSIPIKININDILLSK